MEIITQQQLDIALELHQLWLHSEEKEGKRLDLELALFEDIWLHFDVLKKARFRDCFLIHVNTDDLNHVIDCEFINCYIQSTDFLCAKLNSVSFLHSILDTVSFNHSTLEFVEFPDAILKTVDFSCANIKNCFF